MNAAEPAPPPQTSGWPRLNPFIFPSGTDFRFALLIAAVIGAGIFVFEMLVSSRPGFQATYLAGAERCVSSVGQPAWPQSPGGSPAGGDLAACMVPYNRPLKNGALIGLALILSASWVIFWMYPAWKIRRRGLQPLTPEDAPEVIQALDVLRREAGLSQAPHYVWNPLDLTGSALAFGRPGRFYLELAGGLVARYYLPESRPEFEAVARHEFAHLRNGDVTKTYFSLAIVWAFIALALPTLVISMIEYPAQALFSLLWRIIAQLGVVYLVLNSVLRQREIYADLRASLWDGPVGALSRLVARLSPEKSGLLRLLRTHPHPQDRLRALEDPLPLFRLNFWEVFTAGLTASLAYMGVQSIMTTLVTRAAWGNWLSSLIFAPFAVGLAGTGVWRATFASLAAPARWMPPLPRVGGLAAGLATGLLFGRILSFEIYFQWALTPAQWPDRLAVASFNLLFGLVLLAGLYLFLVWIALGARVWLEVAARWRMPRTVYLLSLVLAGLLVSRWLGVIYGYASLATDSGSILFVLGIVLLSIPVLLPASPLFTLGLASLWAFPLAAWLWRRSAGPLATAAWSYLEGPPPLLPATGRPLAQGLRPGLAILTGLGAAVAYTLLLGLIRIGARMLVPAQTWAEEQFILTFFIAQVALAVLLQVGAAILVAVWVRRMGALHGLMAAQIGGGLMAAALLALNLLFGGSLNWSFAWTTFGQVVNLGALAALFAALPVSAAVAWFRGLGEPEPRPAIAP